MPRITSADHGDTMLVHDITVYLRDEMEQRGGKTDVIRAKKKTENAQTELITH